MAVPAKKRPISTTTVKQWYVLGLGYALGRIHADALAGGPKVGTDYAAIAEDFGQQVGQRFRVKHMDETKVAGELAACWHEYSHGVPLVPVVETGEDRDYERASAEAFFEGMNEHRL